MIDGFHRALRSELEKVANDRRAQLAIASDWSDFRHRVGYVTALDDVLALCKEIERKIYGEDGNR